MLGVWGGVGCLTSCEAWPFVNRFICHWSRCNRHWLAREWNARLPLRLPCATPMLAGWGRVGCLTSLTSCEAWPFVNRFICHWSRCNRHWLAREWNARLPLRLLCATPMLAGWGGVGCLTSLTSCEAWPFVNRFICHCSWQRVGRRVKCQTTPKTGVSFVRGHRPSFPLLTFYIANSAFSFSVCPITSTVNIIRYLPKPSNCSRGGGWGVGVYQACNATSSSTTGSVVWGGISLEGW